MNRQRYSVLGLSLLVLIEYTLGGLVTFSDTTDSAFQLSSFTLSWPGILPTIHRLFAVVLIILWIVLSLYLRGSRAYTFSQLTLGLIVVQAIIGLFIPVTQNSAANSYVIIVHFAVSGLVIAAAGFTAILGWFSVPPPAGNKVRTRQEAQ